MAPGSANGETHVVEWQESWRDDYLRWLCGFATADNGCAVTSESWLPIQLVGRKTGYCRRLARKRRTEPPITARAARRLDRVGIATWGRQAGLRPTGRNRHERAKISLYQ